MSEPRDSSDGSDVGDAELGEALEALAHRELPEPAIGEALDRDADLREALVEQLAIDRLLRTRANPPSADLVAGVMGRIAAREAAGAAPAPGSDRLRRRPRRRSGSPWRPALAAAAAALALAAIGFALMAPRDEPAPQAGTPSSQPTSAEPAPSIVSRPTTPSRPPVGPDREQRLAGYERELAAGLALLERERHAQAGRHLAAAWTLRETPELAALIELNTLLARDPAAQLDALIALCEQLREAEASALASFAQAQHRRWTGERTQRDRVRRGDAALARAAWREARGWYARVPADSVFRAAAQAGDLRCRGGLADALLAEAERLLAAGRHADAVARLREAQALAPPARQAALAARRLEAERQLAAASGEPPREPKKPVRTGHRLLVIGCQGSEAAAVAAGLRALAGPAVEVELRLCGGRLLLESAHHPDHQAETRAALAAAARASHVLIVDSPLAARYPEHHFEGVYQLQRQLRALDAQPLLLQLPGQPAATAELVQRVARGLSAEPVPVSAVQAADRRASRSDAAAAATLAVLDRGASPIEHALVIKANPVVAHLRVTPQLSGSFHTRGRVHLLPLPMPPGKEPRVILTGTSSESVWQKALAGMGGPRAARLANDDEQRRFGDSDLALARPVFARHPDQFVILFARAFAVGARQARGNDQRFLQCQVYSKVEPVTETMTLESVARRVFHPFEVVSKYEQARQHDLSFIPLHVALARVRERRPALRLSANHVKPTRPFFDMLAAMSWVSRTGERLERVPEASAPLIDVGVEVVRQLAHLTLNGEPGFELERERWVHCAALAARLQGRVEVPADVALELERRRAARGLAAAERKELDALMKLTAQAIAEQRLRIDRLRAHDPPRMAAELGALARRLAGSKLGARLARDHKTLLRSSRYRSELKLHAAWLEARQALDAIAPGAQRAARAKQLAPALQALCQRLNRLPLSATVLVWLADEGA